ncbi:MAG: PcfJ domain-containing protein, partial [Eubacteriales bacterium]|nr:PcfJ domain-containing protein [Eubacteriales bacterium]
MILNFETYPWIEYIIKAGLLNLAAEKIGMSWGNMDIDTSERKLTAALGIDGNRLNRLKRMNGGYVALEWLRWEQEQENAGHPVRVTEESLMILKRKKVAPRECVDILRELKSVNRMANYLKKQRQTGYNTIALWRDYLQMAAMEGMDVQDDIVRFPKNLKERHDQLVEIRNARVEKKRYEKLNAEIRKHLPEVRRIFWETPEYMFIPAGKCEELIQEGRTLHHCVGSSTTYMNRMAAGTSWIVFLRRKDNLEKPYYTLEVSMEPEKNNQILQWYSEYDRKPDKQIIEKLLKRYKAFLDKGMRIQIAI